MLQMLLPGLAVAIGLALAGGFLGRLHPAGDSLAVFRGPLAVAGLLVGAAGVATGTWGGWALLLPVGVALAHAAPRFRRERPGPVTLYQKNMSFRMEDVAPLARDIRAVAPDFLTLQEVTPANARLLDAVSDILPHRHVVRYEWVGAVALASRWPISPGSQRAAHGLAAARIEAPHGSVWLVSVHLRWPWPDRQVEQHRKMMPILDSLDGPVILGGDFNMVRWSSLVRRTARAIGAGPAGRVRTTFRLKGLLGLPIDQVLVPEGGPAASETRPLLGSDHRGLVARFRIGRRTAAGRVAGTPTP